LFNPELGKMRSALSDWDSGVSIARTLAKEKKISQFVADPATAFNPKVGKRQ